MDINKLNGKTNISGQVYNTDQLCFSHTGGMNDKKFMKHTFGKHWIYASYDAPNSRHGQQCDHILYTVGHDDTHNVPLPYTTLIQSTCHLNGVTSQLTEACPFSCHTIDLSIRFYD